MARSTDNKPAVKGLVLGKFMPPHLGHVYLVDFARRFAGELNVVVETQPSDPIDGFQRFEWMKSLFAEQKLHHLHKVMPQEPVDHPDFWNLWRTELTRLVGDDIDYVFASEKYGHRLAQELDAEFIPVDRSRSIRPVSGTAVRDDPFAHWDLLPGCVKSFYAQRVCIFGPESTGKSTLTEKLAEHYRTIAVPEYARTYIEELGRDPSFGCMEKIARGQRVSEESLAAYANRLLFMDTDPLATVLWTRFLFDRSCESVQAVAHERTADLYLLLDPDVPWVEDSVRYLPEKGGEFHQACIELLEQTGCDWVPISGSWDERFEMALAAIDSTLVKKF